MKALQAPCDFTPPRSKGAPLGPLSRSLGRPNRGMPSTLRAYSDKQTNYTSNKYKGGYIERAAVGPEDGDWDVIPLSVNSLGNAPAPTTWPSEQARKALYSDIPVDQVDGMHLPIHGTLPPWLRGSFYRNGPGKFRGASAVFDGCAMIVKFALQGNTQSVVASHRFIESTYYKVMKASGGRIPWTLAHEAGAGRGPLGRLQYLASLGAGAISHGVHMGDNALVSVFPQGKELVAHTETLSGTYRIDPGTLQTLGRMEFPDGISGLIKTAHPHAHSSGDIYNLACDFMPVATGSGRHRRLRPPQLTLYRHPATDPTRRELVAEIPYLRASTPTWIHQVAVSERYAAVVQNPVFYDIRKMIFGESGDYLVFKWEPEAGSLIHIIPLDSNDGPVKTYRAPAFLATHWINAFESLSSDDGRPLLHLHACVSADPRSMSHWDLQTVRSGVQGGQQIQVSLMRELTIDLSAPDGSYVNTQPLLKPLIPDEAHGYAFELPSINPNVTGHRHRYVYGASCIRPSNCWNSLVKADIATGKVDVWHEAGGACWEPVFVPRPGADHEDDGAVLSTIMQKDGKSALLVLDAKSWKEVARAVLPYGLPNGFHGCFIPEE